MTIEEMNEIEYRMNLLKPLYDKMIVYLKSTILKQFQNMKFLIIYEDKEIYGINNRINIRINFKKICDDHQDDNERKWQLVAAMIHESIHSLQFVDWYKYDTDIDYCCFIESNCDYSTQQFMNKNYIELKTIVGCDYTPLEFYFISDDYYNRLNLYDADSSNLDIRLFLNLVSCVTYGKYDNYKEKLYKVYYSYKNIIVDYILRDKDNKEIYNKQFLLKYDGKIDVNVYYELHTLLFNNYCSVKYNNESIKDTISFRIYCKNNNKDIIKRIE